MVPIPSRIRNVCFPCVCGVVMCLFKCCIRVVSFREGGEKSGEDRSNG